MRFSLILSIFACLFISSGLYADPIIGKWSIRMDADPDAGSFKDKDIAVIEFMKARNGSYYFVVEEVKNNYPTHCESCPGNMKGKQVADRSTQWGKNFTYDESKKYYTGGIITEPSTGKNRRTNLRVVDENTLEFFSEYPEGKRKGQMRTITLHRIS